MNNSRSSSYRKLNKNENDLDLNLNDNILLDNKLKIDNEDIKKIRKKKAEFISIKIHAFLWVVVGIFLIYSLDFFYVCFKDKRVKRFYFNIGLIGLSANTCIAFYLAIYLPYIRKNNMEWSIYCPRMIPTATFFAVITLPGFILGLWPVWGLLTPGILGVLFISSLMTAHFLPSI